MYSTCCSSMLLLICGDIESCPGPAHHINEMDMLCKSKGMKLFHQNIRGIFTNFNGLCELFDSNQNIDVMTLSETHLSDTDLTSNPELYKIHGYDFIYRNRKEGKGGGVAVYIKSSFRWKRRIDLECDDVENIWVEIFVNKSKSFLIATVYKPPESSNYLSNKFNEHFNNMLLAATTLSKEVILMGDCNVNFLKARENIEFKSLLSLYGFEQLIKSATRITESTSTLIDIIASNNASTIKHVNVIPTSLSDHDMVGCVRKINHIKYQPKIIKCRDFSKYNHISLADDLNRANWASVYKAKSVEKAINPFNGILNDAFDKHAPFINKKVKGRPCPWLDVNVKRSMNERDKFLRKARRTNLSEDWKNYKTQRNKCNNNLRFAKRRYHNNLLNQNTLNPKSFWDTIKRIFLTKCTGRILQL